MKNQTYADAILSAFEFILKNYNNSYLIGQGLWSPWYVGSTMKNLEVKFGKDRVIDSPVSESAVTGAAIGSSLVGMKPIVIHPRMDFMLYAMDAIINQAAKWGYLFGKKNTPSVVIRAIINRGGEQGAQHSQALHNFFCHTPGLDVVMPYSVKDARNLLISSVLSNKPVVYIDDRWLYDTVTDFKNIKSSNNIEELKDIKPNLIKKGDNCTVIASGYSVYLSKLAFDKIDKNKKFDLFDLRKLTNISFTEIFESIKKTGKLLVVDGGTTYSGFSSEIITQICESKFFKYLKSSPKRLALPDHPAPTSSNEEINYYFNEDDIVKILRKI